jgi:hypothetical protein
MRTPLSSIPRLKSKVTVQVIRAACSKVSAECLHFARRYVMHVTGLTDNPGQPDQELIQRRRPLLDRHAQGLEVKLEKDARDASSVFDRTGIVGHRVLHRWGRGRGHKVKRDDQVRRLAKEPFCDCIGSYCSVFSFSDTHLTSLDLASTRIDIRRRDHAQKVLKDREFCAGRIRINIIIVNVIVVASDLGTHSPRS